MLKNCLRVLPLLMAVLGLPVTSLAQSTFGTILGTVTDATGARVAGVSVTITNQGEEISKTVNADEFGNYEAINLKAGVYTVKSEAPGFKSFMARDLQLVARQTIRVDVTLEVGSLAETVNVSAKAPVVNTETGTIATSFDSGQVLTIPSNYRGAGSTSPLRVLAFQPGVNSDNGTGFSVQGATPVQTEYSLDGISTVSVRSNGALPEVFPSAEGIAEMKVQGVGNNAEYGQVGDITTTSRGGSNALHGSAFEYLQNRALDATALGSTVKPQKSANTFGGSLGGPIKRNRAFFFGTFEDMQYHTGTNLQATVPTEAIRRGDFSKESYTVKDPFAGGAAFAGNIVPASRISPVAANVLKYYPLPNFGRTDVQTASNYRSPAAAPITSWQWDGRVDYTISNHQFVFGRLSWKNVNTTSPLVFLLPNDTGTNNSRSLTLSHVDTIRPNLVNEFRFGFAISNAITTYGFDGRQITSEIGLKTPAELTFNGLPTFSFSSGTTGFGKGKPGFTFSHSYQWNNNTTWSVGRHTVKFGADVRRLRVQTSLGFTGSDNYGNTSFDGRFSGRDLSDFLLGLPYGSNYASVNQDNDGLAWHYAVYAQDSFKVSRRLSLEYGLRWELHPPFDDLGGNITNFDRSVPVTGRVIIPSMQHATDITSPGFLLTINACPAPAYQGIPCTPFLKAKDAGFPEGLRYTQWKNFNPRFGFAFRPFNDTKTVIRGSAGRYTMTLLGQVFYGLTGISSSDVREYTNSITNGVPLFQFPNIVAGSGVRAGAYGSAYFGTAEDPTYKDPYSYQWNLSVERDLGWDTGLRVSYIALRSLQMPWAPDLNQPQPSTVPYAQRPLTDRPFPYWSRLYSYDTGANAMYNSMQVELNHRMRSGLTFDSAWTWAKNLGDGNGPAATGWAGANGGGRVTNSLDRAADRGNFPQTRRHRFTTTLFYDLPFGRGRAFGSHMNRAADLVAGGWRLASVVLIQTGTYLTPTFTGGDPSGTNAPARGSMRPDRVGDGNLANPTASMYFDRFAFVCPGRIAGAANQFDCNVAPIGRFGNAGTGILVGPGTVNLSMGLGKDFTLTERARLRLEGTFTNLPNHPNLADPSTNISSVGFGIVTSARGGDSGGNRVGQISLRLEF